MQKHSARRDFPASAGTIKSSEWHPDNIVPAESTQAPVTRNGRGVSLLEKNLLFEQISDNPAATATTMRVAFKLLFRFLNCETLQCNPSLQTLARTTGRESRSVKRSMKWLVEEGYFRKLSRGGPGRGSNHYEPALERVRVPEEAPAAPEAPEPDQPPANPRPQEPRQRELRTSVDVKKTNTNWDAWASWFAESGGSDDIQQARDDLDRWREMVDDKAIRNALEDAKQRGFFGPVLRNHLQSRVDWIVSRRPGAKKPETASAVVPRENPEPTLEKHDFSKARNPEPTPRPAPAPDPEVVKAQREAEIKWRRDRKAMARDHKTGPTIEGYADAHPELTPEEEQAKHDRGVARVQLQCYESA